MKESTFLSGIGIIFLIGIFVMLVIHGVETPHKSNNIQREYQFDVDEEGYYIYSQDGNYLGFVPWKESKSLDSIIIDDNQ